MPSPQAFQATVNGQYHITGHWSYYHAEPDLHSSIFASPFFFQSDTILVGGERVASTPHGNVCVCVCVCVCACACACVCVYMPMHKCGV